MVTGWITETQTRRARHTWAALRLAWHALDTEPRGDPATGKMTPGHLHGFEGVCQLQVGDPARVHDILDQAQAALTTPRDRVQRGIVTTDLALARLRMGAPEAAATLLQLHRAHRTASMRDVSIDGREPVAYSKAGPIDVSRRGVYQLAPARSSYLQHRLPPRDVHCRG